MSNEDAEIVAELRQAAQRVTGGNCAFADDDLAILEHLALRAVRAGLTDGLSPQVRRCAEDRLAKVKTVASERRRYGAKAAERLAKKLGNAP